MDEYNNQMSQSGEVNGGENYEDTQRRQQEREEGQEKALVPLQVSQIDFYGDVL
jgi:hypothetical protein